MHDFVLVHCLFLNVIKHILDGTENGYVQIKTGKYAGNITICSF